MLGSGCTSDLPGNMPPDGVARVNFGASLESDMTVYTRGGNPGLDSIYVANDPWSGDFYIQLNTKGESGEDIKQYGTYIVPSAYEGRLESKDPAEALDWQSLDKEHTFYSWTVPWLTEGYEPSDNTLEVDFLNSSEADGFKENHNNAILEKFIGAKSLPYSYLSHGKYVDLTFHHLVSKIIVESLILIESNGSVQENLKADMTFVGMPTQATFYPHPTTGDASGAPENWRPYVGKPWEQSDDAGVTYYIANEPGKEDVFYICPEVDFSTIDFQIKLRSDGFFNYDYYYGTFDDVIFSRTPGMGYDQGDDTEEDYIDKKILHAGEEMRVNIVLIPGVGPGLKIVITPWSTDKPVDSTYHPHQGIYSDAEIREWLDLLFSFKNGEYENPPEELELLFQLYGYEKDGKKYIPIFENIVLPPYGSNNPSNIFPVPDGYIIDGMGHTITAKTNTQGHVHNGRPYYNVGPCRDIYFTDPNGNHTIYIDSEGYVWVTDDNGQLVQTKNQLPDLKPGERGYDIDSVTGEIRVTSYFNNNIGS